MNRRGFLATLLAIPFVGPAIAKRAPRWIEKLRPFESARLERPPAIHSYSGMVLEESPGIHLTRVQRGLTGAPFIYHTNGRTAWHGGTFTDSSSLLPPEGAIDMKYKPNLPDWF